jgi:N-acetylneuraminate synthase
LYREAHTPWEWHEPLFARAASLGLDFFSTPFDETAVDFLEGLEVPRYKIASIEIVDLPLIRRVTKTGKPIVISTGASTLDEVRRAVEAVREIGDQPLTLLVCSSSYPASAASANLASMSTLRANFGVAVGYSDHTLGSASAVAAAVLGADMIEKHLTLDASGGGPDDGFSSGPAAFAHLVSEVKEAISALGSEQVYVSEEEEQSRALRPSLWVTRDVAAGELVGPDNVASLRPSGGLPPDMVNAVQGKPFKSAVSRGTPLVESLLGEA